MAGKGRKRARPRPWEGHEAPSAPDAGRLRGRVCATKVTHDNQTAAEQAALEHEHRFGEAKAAYRCRWCGRWHVGALR